MCYLVRCMPTHHRQLQGNMISRAGDKTIVVRVERTVLHPVYKTRYQMSKKYHVHDPANAHSVGDAVTFIESRPLSKTKRWRVVGGTSAEQKRTTLL